MITILIGEVTDYNKYRIQEITDKFPRALIINRNTTKDFKKWFSKIKRPIIGDRILVTISEMEALRRNSFDVFKSILNEIKNHDYIDVLWLIPETKGNFNDIVTDMNLVLLRQTYKSDFLRFVQDKYPETSTKVLRYMLNRIGFNNRTFNLHQLKFDSLYNSKGTFSKSDVDSIITTRQMTPILQVLFENLKRSDKGLRDYYLYCEKYGQNWVHNFYIDNLEEVLALKIKYYKGNSLKISDIKNSEKDKKYYQLIADTTINEVYILLSLLKTKKYPLELYKNNSIQDLLNTK